MDDNAPLIWNCYVLIDNIILSTAEANSKVKSNWKSCLRALKKLHLYAEF